MVCKICNGFGTYQRELLYATGGVSAAIYTQNMWDEKFFPPAKLRQRFARQAYTWPCDQEHWAQTMYVDDFEGAVVLPGQTDRPPAPGTAPSKQ